MTEPRGPEAESNGAWWARVVSETSAEDTVPPKPVVSAEPALLEKPATSAESNIDGGGAIDSVRKLMTLSPMLDYVTIVAERTYGHLSSKRSPLSQFKAKSPRVYKWAVGLDLFFRGVLMTLVVAAVVLILFKGFLSPIVINNYPVAP